MKTSSKNDRARASEARRGRLNECRLLVTVTSVVLQFGRAIVSVRWGECQHTFVAVAAYYLVFPLVFWLRLRSL